MIKFRLTSIKLNNEQRQSTVIDWEQIQTDDETKQMFNEKLQELMSSNQLQVNDCTNFNSAILIAAQDTATTDQTKNQGWFHHLESNLLPVILHRGQLLHQLRSTDPSSDTTKLKKELKTTQKFVTNYVSHSKAAWSTHQAQIIYSICFNPKEAWASVIILAGGTTSHHEEPTVMQLRFTSRELATNNAENASVIGPYLEKIYRSHRPVDW